MTDHDMLFRDLAKVDSFVKRERAKRKAVRAITPKAPKLIYLVQAEHWHVPGRPMSAHATKASAEAEALSLVNMMLTEAAELVKEAVGKGNVRQATNHAEGLKRLQKWLGTTGDDSEDDADVWITELQVRP